jgi:uncharacterized membrane protein
MDFLLWSARALHIFSMVVWLGGLMYQAVVTFPIAHADQSEPLAQSLRFVGRFLPFVWLSVWTMLVTGVVLMLFDPRFMFFRYQDRWSIVLGLKQLMFLLLLFFSFGYARMFKRVEELVNEKQGDADDTKRMYYQRMIQFSRINLTLGIVAILLAAAL